MNKDQFQLLREPRFFPLFITQFLSAFNDNAFRNALIVLVTYQLNLSNTQKTLLVSLAFALFTAPYFLFSALAGQIADKLPKSSLTKLIKGFEVCCMLLGGIGFSTHNVTLLLLTLFLLGAHSAFFGPIKYAILPEYLNGNELIAGNALVEASTFIAILLGTIIGSQLSSNTLGSYFISILLFIVATAGLLSSLYMPYTPQAAQELVINYRFLQQTKSIIQYTKKNRDVYLAILGISWFWLIGTVMLAQLPNFTFSVIGANVSVYTLFLATFAIGITIGSLLCSKLLGNEVNTTYIPLSILGLSIFLADAYFATNHIVLPLNHSLIGLDLFLQNAHYWRLLGDILFLAISGGIYTVPLYAIMQARSEIEFRSRTIACNNIINSLFMVAAGLVTTLLLLLHFTIPQIFLTLAIANAFIALYICKILPEAVVKSFVNWLLRALYQVDVKGIENYKKVEGEAIIIANHTSFLDILLLAAFLPDKFTIAVNTDVARKWWIKPFIALVETYLIDPTNPIATKSIINIVKSGKKVVIFPEGRLTVTGGLMKVYEGPGLIADKSGAELIPIRIDGAQYTPFSRLRGKVRIRWFPKITLTIMPARRFTVPQDISSRHRREFIANKLYTLMTEMLFTSSPYQQTLFHGLLEARAIHGGRKIIVEDTKRKPMRYQQFISRCFILGNTIHRYTPDTYLGIMLPTSMPTILTFFAMQLRHHIPVMINFSSGVHSIIASCQTIPLKTIYTSRLFVNEAKLDHLIEALTAANINIIYLEDFRKKINSVLAFKNLLLSYFSKWLYRYYAKQHNSQDAAVVLFTSGSEGNPKGVVLSHQNLLANCYQLCSRVDFNSRDIMFNALPVFHSFGLTVGCILPIMTGSKTFLYPSPLHYRIVPELVYDTNATILLGTDTFLNGYARYAHPYDFYSVRYIFAGAEKLKKNTYQVWAEKFGLRIFEGYGVTETSPVLAMNTPMQNQLGTVGCLVPGINYQIQAVPGISEGGRLFISGPNVMLGYINNEKPGELQALNDGWHDTGDIVTLDNAGYLSITGRAKRFAKIGGEMISLVALENYIHQLYPEENHAAIQVPDPQKGEQIILITESKTLTREAILHCLQKQGISELYLPKKIFAVNQIPLLATGKVNYPAAIELATKF